MPKTLKHKIYKACKKVLNEKEFICIQVKHLRAAQLRELKRDINNLTDGWLEPKNEDSESSLIMKFPHGVDVMTPVY